jgi:hypothetical protein
MPHASRLFFITVVLVIKDKVRTLFGEHGYYFIQGTEKINLAGVDFGAFETLAQAGIFPEYATIFRFEL